MVLRIVLDTFHPLYMDGKLELTFFYLPEGVSLSLSKTRLIQQDKSLQFCSFMLQMKTKLLIACLFFLAFTPTIFSQEEHLILQGKIGKSPIIIDVPCLKDGGCDGTYYYENYQTCVDVNIEQDTITLIGEKDHWGKNSGEITIKIIKQKNDRWRGIYTKKDTVNNFKLTTVDLKKLPHKYGHLPSVDSLKKTDPFLYTIIANQTYDLKISGKNFKFDSLSTKVKHIIEDIRFQEIIYHMVRPCDGRYDSDINEASVCNNILSFQIAADWDGGVHPDWGTNIIQIDLKKEKQIEISEIVAAEELSANIIWILSSYLPKQFIEITDMYKESEGECNYFQDGLLAPTGFSCEGIYIGATFHGMARSCDSFRIAVVPFSLLKDRGYLMPDYEYLGGK